MPPYLPISWSGLTTSGWSGTRCSTGGSLPALTSSASIGASASFAGRPASAMIVGPSSLPIMWRPGFSTAPAAGLGASAGFAGAAAAAVQLRSAGGLRPASPASGRRWVGQPRAGGACVAAGGGASAGFAAGGCGAHAASSPTPPNPIKPRRKNVRLVSPCTVAMGASSGCEAPNRPVASSRGAGSKRVNARARTADEHSAPWTTSAGPEDVPHHGRWGNRIMSL